MIKHICRTLVMVTVALGVLTGGGQTITQYSEPESSLADESSPVAYYSASTIEAKREVMIGHSVKKPALEADVEAVEEVAAETPEDEWEPSPDDVALISRTIWGEVRGCPVVEQRAQAWCILNRVDDPRWGDTIEKVVLQPSQFQGYSPNNPVEPFEDMATEIIVMWHNGEYEIPRDMCFCGGDGKHQRFRTDWIPNENTRYYP